MELRVAGQMACGACRTGEAGLLPFTMAFQPIVEVERREVVAYEALVRGTGNEPASTVLRQVTPETLYAFDQACRVKAIRLAAQLGLGATGAHLSINFLPGAVYSPAACIQRTLQTAAECSFPLEQLIFELTEVEQVRDTGHLSRIVTEYRKHGFTLALDDFGMGYSSMCLLAELQVQKIKLDARLVRGLDTDVRKRQVVCSLVELCRSLEVDVVAEAVETVGEYDTLRGCGISLMQGCLFAKPAFEALPPVTWPGAAEGEVAEAVGRALAGMAAAPLHQSVVMGS